MSTIEDASSAFPYTSRSERPYLLPFNRRLRHLHGISLRNLTLTTSPLRHRAGTYDDEQTPGGISSPRKLLELNESHKSPRSRSQSNIQSEKDAEQDADSEAAKANGHAVTPTKNSKHRKLRRQSTLDWQANTPRHRRRKVEDAVARHSGDVFFSLHVDDVEKPLYVSEIITRTMNPDFRYFDLGELPSAVKRGTTMSIRLWTRSESAAHDDWTFLLDRRLDLRELEFVGRNMESFSKPLSENCVMFMLTDGIYVYPPEVGSKSSGQDDFSLPTFSQSTLPANIESASSYEALMKLSTLDTCVQDALSTHAQLTSEILELMTAKPAYITEPTTLSIVKDTNASAHRAVNHTKNQISKLRGQVASLRKGIDTRREAMRAGHAAHTNYYDTLSDAESTLLNSRVLHKQLIDDITGQRRRIVTDLSTIYPIEPARPRHARQNSSLSSGTSTPRGASPHPPPLSFTIRSLSLPNSNFAAPGLASDAAAAALGHTAHALSLLAAYFSMPLPYPLHPRGSASTVSDPISKLSSPQRTFPLHLPDKYATTAAAAGTAAFDRFEYAVFLLNKDVEALCGRAAGLRVLDPRHTLPNLKYLGLVAVAGPGDVPLRKAGGVRGLLARGDGASSTAGSRRGSDESATGEGGRAAEAVRRKLRGAT